MSMKPHVFYSLFKMAPKMQKNGRNVAVGMILAGKRLEDIARHFNVHRNTISRLKSKFAMTGSIEILYTKW